MKVKTITQSAWEFCGVFIGFIAILGLASNSQFWSCAFGMVLLALSIACFVSGKLPKTAGLACISLAILSALNVYFLTTETDPPFPLGYIIPFLFGCGLVLAIVHTESIRSE
jgi:hypothetical protein